MKSKKLLSLILSFSTLLSGTFLVSHNVQAETTVKTIQISQNNLSQVPQPTSTLDSNGKLKPLKLTMAKIKAIPFIYSTPTDTSKKSNLVTTSYIASYTAPYSQINTPLGLAIFLQNGCTDNDTMAYGWVSALQTDLNHLSRNYRIGFNLTVDGIYGSSTASAIRTFQCYIKNSRGCSSISIDGVAGYQTWTAIYALFGGYNPHSFIS